MKKVRLGISVGDINGVGLELIIKGFQDLSLFEYCNPIYALYYLPYPCYFSGLIYLLFLDAIMGNAQ